MFKARSSVRQFLIFCLIGVINTIIHLSVFSFVLNYVSTQALSNAIGFLFGLVFSFFMNAKFTFRQKTNLTKFLKMGAVSGALSVFFGALGDMNQWNPFITFLLYVCFNPLISFISVKFLVFSRS